MSDKASAALERATALRAAKRPTDALAELGPALVDARTAYPAFNLQALALAESGRVEAAIAAAKRAQALEPLDEQGFRTEGWIRVNKLKGAGAEGVLRESVRLAPGLFNRYLLVLALRRRGQQSEARAIASELVIEFPHAAPAFDALGMVELRERRWREAEVLFRRAAELAPHDAVYASRLGTALQAQGKTENAAEAYLAAARSDPTNSAHRRRLGRVGLSVGAAGVLAVGKFGLLALIPKIVVIVGASRLLNSSGSNSAAAEPFGLWVLVVLYGVIRLGRRAILLRRGVAVLPDAIRPDIARDNRAAVGRELLSLSTVASLVAIWLWTAGGLGGLLCLILSLAAAVTGWRMAGGIQVRRRLSDVWPPSLNRIPLGLAMGITTLIGVAPIYPIYGLLLPAVAPRPVQSAIFPQFGWTLFLSVVLPIVASIRGVIRPDLNARAQVVRAMALGLGFVVLMEAAAAYLSFIARVPNRSATMGIVWVIATLGTIAIVPRALEVARRIQCE